MQHRIAMHGRGAGGKYTQANWRLHSSSSTTALHGWFLSARVKHTVGACTQKVPSWKHSHDRFSVLKQVCPDPVSQKVPRTGSGAEHLQSGVVEWQQISSTQGTGTQNISTHHPSVAGETGTGECWQHAPKPNGFIQVHLKAFGVLQDTFYLMNQEHGHT